MTLSGFNVLKHQPPAFAGDETAEVAVGSLSSFREESESRPSHPLRLSRREKKAIRVQTTTGVEYSLHHIERLIKRGDAYTDPSGCIVIGKPDPDAGERLLIRRLRGAPDLSTLIGESVPAANFDILPVIPRYSGRPLEDFLAAAERNVEKKQQQP